MPGLDLKSNKESLGGLVGFPVSGQYATVRHSGTASGAPAQNVAYYLYLPMAVAWGLAIIGVEAVTGVASTTIRLGLFADSPTAPGNPGALLVDTGPLPTANTGPVESAISQGVSGPGIWLASVRQSASGATLRLISGSGEQRYTRNALTTVTGFVLNCMSQSGVTGPFASNPTGLIGDANGPLVAIKYA